jgi:hypothetical protein
VDRQGRHLGDGAHLGGAALIDLIVEHTHTCYTPDRTTRHPWGFGCGSCPACTLRAKGWDAWQASRQTPRPDPRRRTRHRRRLGRAHKIVQADEADATSCWIHAVLHKIEGDIGNSRYWYRRAGNPTRPIPTRRPSSPPSRPC